MQKQTEYIGKVELCYDCYGGQDLYQDGFIRSISEIYDSKKPQLPRGAFAQARSIAEVFRIIVEKQEPMCYHKSANKYERCGSFFSTYKHIIVLLFVLVNTGG